MFIAGEIKKNCSKPRRGGIGLCEENRAAPLGLERVKGECGCYKHGAPTELGWARSFWADRAQCFRRPNRPALDARSSSSTERKRIYYVTAGTFHKQWLFDAPGRLDLVERMVLSLAKKCVWQLEAWDRLPPL